MFTGIIEGIGRVREVSRKGASLRLIIESKDISKDVNIGDSVSVNGACLTVAEKNTSFLYFDVVEETLKKTTLRNLKREDLVNLEESLKVGDPLAGHLVSGHVDCLGEVKQIERLGENVSMEIAIPEGFSNLIVEKGSIAIDGISLTVGDVKKSLFKVYFIPHTLKVTTLGTRKAGDEVNVEFDMLGKYVAREKELESDSKITEEFLKEKGFI